MDPQEALLKMREAMEIIAKRPVDVGIKVWLQAARDLAEAAAALDTWMANGGFIPEGWMLHRQAV